MRQYLVLQKSASGKFFSAVSLQFDGGSTQGGIRGWVYPERLIFREGIFTLTFAQYSNRSVFLLVKVSDAVLGDSLEEN